MFLGSVVNAVPIIVWVVSIAKSNVPAAECDLRDLTACRVRATPAAGETGKLADDDPVPREFVAATEHWYAVPLIKPDTNIGEDVPVPLADPLIDVQVAVYDVIAEPPVAEGAVKLMLA